MAKYVVWGTYCGDVEVRRAPYRQAHLEGLARQKAAGLLLTIGPTADLTRVLGIYEAPTAEMVRELIESDPYWQQGIWTGYEIYPWIQAV